MLSAPKFWYKKEANFFARKLTPLANYINKKIRIKEHYKMQAKVRAAVVVVGNITIGGAGKTPIVNELVKYFSLKIKTAVISRGYKGKLVKKHAPIKVSQQHSAIDVGDEALIHKEFSDCFVCPDRLKAANMAMSYSNKLLIMDDGLQNHQIYKDYKILVIDSKRGFGNKRLIPAGPLRSRLVDALNDANVVLITGEDSKDIRKEIALYSKDLPVYNVKFKSEITRRMKRYPVVAFAGIADNEKFFNSLTASNVDLIKKYSFSDHHLYSRRQIQKIIRYAQKHNATIMTTSKDFVKIPVDLQDQIIEIKLTIKLPKAFLSDMEKFLNIEALKN